MHDPQLYNKEKLASPVPESTKDEQVLQDRPIAEDLYYYSKKKLARPAPEPTTSTSSTKDEKKSKNNVEPNKKRRQNEDTLPDTTRGLSQCLTELSQCTATKATFKRIQKLIINTSITRDAKNKTYWNQYSSSPDCPLFIRLLQKLLDYINNQLNLNSRLHALDTLIKMIVDLRALFKEMEEKGRNTTMYQLVKTLVDNNSDSQSEVGRIIKYQMSLYSISWFLD
jgi:hypothetical protein